MLKREWAKTREEALQLCNKFFKTKVIHSLKVNKDIMHIALIDLQKEHTVFKDDFILYQMHEEICKLLDSKAADKIPTAIQQTVAVQIITNINKKQLQIYESTGNEDVEDFLLLGDESAFSFSMASSPSNSSDLESSYLHSELSDSHIHK